MDLNCTKILNLSKRVKDFLQRRAVAMNDSTISRSN